MGRLGLLVAVSLAGMLLFAASASSFSLVSEYEGDPSLIDQAAVDQPIEVVLWVRTTVTPENQAWITDEIRQGLDHWESVPTSRIRFDMTVIRSATMPQRDPEDLWVFVGNAADLTSGGATFPGGGYPGGWAGAVADLPSADRDHFDVVAAHEVGHAIGFPHSTITSHYFGANNLPIMHWAGAEVQDDTEDDAAAVSVAYPEPATPLSSVTGTIRGRTVAQGSSQPLTGVNAVAINTTTGKPIVARVSGATGPAEAGRFDVVGLPPGSYNLLLMNGGGMRGSFLGLPAQRFQSENFDDVTLGPYTVNAGSVVDIGDRPIAIQPPRIDNIEVQGSNLGDRNWLPPITAGQPYSAKLRIDGGVRPLTLRGSSGLPGGVSASIEFDEAHNSGPPGRTYIRLSGTPQQGGDFAPSFEIRDDHGADTTISLGLEPATAEVMGPQLKFRAQPGQFNDVTVSRSGDSFTVTDGGVDQIHPGNRCQATADPKTVTCSAAAPGQILSMDLDLGDRDDSATIESPIGNVYTLIRGGDGDDLLNGGDGTEWFDGGTGSDVLNGGGGFDTASYVTRTGAVRADIDGTADDGQSGERDNIEPDVENIDGGSGNDRLIGSTASNTINGNGGADRIYGYRSASSKSGDAGDLLVGDDGDDRLYGQAGGDQLFGEDYNGFATTGNDRLYGGYGNDYIEGGFGQNGIYGQGDDDFVFSIASGFDNIKTSSGDDTVIADDGDGKDRLSCSAGLDSFRADSAEPASSCELTAP